MRGFAWFITLVAMTFLVACTGSTIQEKKGASNTQVGNSSNPQQAASKIKQLSDFELKMLEGNGDLKAVKLSQTIGQGKVVVIDFWATWCPPCLKSIPDLIALHNEYQDKGVEIYGLSVEDPEEANRKDPTKKNQQAVANMSKDLKMNYQVGFATQSMFSAFDQRGMGSIPQTFIFGKDGSLVRHLVGFDPNKAPQLIRESVDKALNS